MPTPRTLQAGTIPKDGVGKHSPGASHLRLPGLPKVPAGPGGEGQPLPILEIASRTIAVVPGITGLIDRLEQAGFVNRLRCAKDRRVIYVALTDHGTETLAALDEPLVARHRKLLGHLSQAELKELIRLLEKVREPLAGMDD